MTPARTIPTKTATVAMKRGSPSRDRMSWSATSLKSAKLLGR
jgi:hypothetical protein